MRYKTLIPMFALVAGMAPGLANADACVPDDPDAAPKVEEVAGFPDGLTGHYAVPTSGSPTRMVVYAHGYRNDSDAWVCHLNDAADRGALAVAMDYRGTGYPGGPDHGNAPASDKRGWFVREGAEDSIAAALYFLDSYPSIDKVGLLGVSMGGNTAGLAAAMGAKRSDGSPLFNYWVNVEGAANVAETYAAATLIEPSGGSLGSYAGGAREDIENELGVTPEEDPVAFAQAIADLSVVTHVDNIAAAGLSSVAIVHGADDGLVPYNQSRELTTLLRAHGVPTSMHTVLRRNDWQNPETASSEGGTVVTGHALTPALAAAGQTYTAPFAGHGWEGSSSHIVITTGFEVLFEMLDGDLAPGNDEWLVDSELDRVKVL